MMADSRVLDERFLSHGNNIRQKERIATKPADLELCREVRRAYDRWAHVTESALEAPPDWAAAVAALNEYVDFAKIVEKRSRMFNWRSDFAGSIIPEFLYKAFVSSFQARALSALFSTRESIVELSLSSRKGAGWHVRKKNQDLCIGLTEEEVGGSQSALRFIVPHIVFEVKTNIDINKLNGLDFSAERLKRTFPSAKYVLVTETVDFSLEDNYAAGAIDEIYVLRRQLRSASRRQKEPLKEDVIRLLVEDVTEEVAKASTVRGHVYERLEDGRLIRFQPL